MASATPFPAGRVLRSPSSCPQPRAFQVSPPPPSKKSSASETPRHQPRCAPRHALCRAGPPLPPLPSAPPARAPSASASPPAGPRFAPLRSPRHTQPATLSSTLGIRLPATLPASGRALPGSRREAGVRDDGAFIDRPASLQPPAWSTLEQSPLRPQPTHRTAEASCREPADGQTDRRTLSSLDGSPLAEQQQPRRRGGRGGQRCALAGHVARRGQSGGSRSPPPSPSSAPLPRTAPPPPPQFPAP